MLGLFVTLLGKFGLSEKLAKIVALVIIVGTIAGSIFAAYRYVSNTRDMMVAAKLEVAQTKQQLASVQESFDTYKADNEKMLADISTLNANIADIQNKVGEYNEIFKKHDWQKLFSAKTDLMLSKFNAGTKRVFMDVEAESSLPDQNGEGKVPAGD